MYIYILYGMEQKLLKREVFILRGLSRIQFLIFSENDQRVTNRIRVLLFQTRVHLFIYTLLVIVLIVSLMIEQPV
jgi:hypothetical protein